MTTNKDISTEANGLPIKYNLAGTMNSLVKIDKKTGWIVEGKISQSIKGKY
ncbi:DUF6263 family protein [Pedobacter steynii]